MILPQCDEPGASVVQVEMSHSINDNVVHRWRQLAGQRKAAQLVATPVADRPTEFEPLALSSSLVAAEEKTEVRPEVRRAAMTVSVA